MPTPWFPSVSPGALGASLTVQGIPLLRRPRCQGILTSEWELRAVDRALAPSHGSGGVIEMQRIKPAFHRRRAERGATALTYGLVVGLVALAGLAAVTRIGTSVEGLFVEVASSIDGQAATATPALSPSPTPSPTVVSIYLDISDAALAATLQANLGDPNTWTLCYDIGAGVAMNQLNLYNACRNYGETLQIDRIAGEFVGAYINAGFDSFLSTSWTYPSGFYFTSVDGREDEVYGHTGLVTSSGTVRIEFDGGQSSQRHHINMYKYNGNTTHTYYHANGDWCDDCNPTFNLVTGTAQNYSGSPAMRIYGR